MSSLGMAKKRKPAKKRKVTKAPKQDANQIAFRIVRQFTREND